MVENKSGTKNKRRAKGKEEIELNGSVASPAMDKSAEKRNKWSKRERRRERVGRKENVHVS